MRIVSGKCGKAQRLEFTSCLGLESSGGTFTQSGAWAGMTQILELLTRVPPLVSSCSLTSPQHGSPRIVGCPTWNSGNRSNPVDKAEDAWPLMTLPGK